MYSLLLLSLSSSSLSLRITLSNSLTHKNKSQQVQALDHRRNNSPAFSSCMYLQEAFASEEEYVLKHGRMSKGVDLEATSLPFPTNAHQHMHSIKYSVPSSRYRGCLAIILQCNEFNNSIAVRLVREVRFSVHWDYAKAPSLVSFVRVLTSNGMRRRE